MFVYLNLQLNTETYKEKEKALLVLPLSALCTPIHSPLQSKTQLAVWAVPFQLFLYVRLFAILFLRLSFIYF